MGNLTGKCQIGRLRRRWDDNIEEDLEEFKGRNVRVVTAGSESYRVAGVRSVKYVETSNSGIAAVLKYNDYSGGDIAVGVGGTGHSDAVLQLISFRPVPCDMSSMKELLKT